MTDRLTSRRFPRAAIQFSSRTRAVAAPRCSQTAATLPEFRRESDRPAQRSPSFPRTALPCRRLESRTSHERRSDTRRPSCPMDARAARWTFRSFRERWEGSWDQILMDEQPVSPVARTGWLPVGPSRRCFALEYFAIDLDVLLEIRGHVLFRKNRRHRALWLAGAAIDAFVWMDVELVRALVDAIDRAHVDAGAVLGVLAGFGYDVRHLFPGSALAAAPW